MNTDKAKFMILLLIINYIKNLGRKKSILLVIINKDTFLEPLIVLLCDVSFLSHAIKHKSFLIEKKVLFFVLKNRRGELKG